MSVSSENPLITFVIFAYNQERFIREAVEGAFSQTYSPLEIIISDDCSSDRTFEIIEEMASSYSGPHKILTNRNDSNFRVTEHIKRVMQLAKTEFLVLSAGDDISLPERSDCLYQEWASSGKKYKAIFSNAHLIDEVGNQTGIFFNSIPDYTKTLGEFISKSRSWIPGRNKPRCWIPGTTMAMHRSIFDVHGSYDNKVLQEDAVLSFRALLLGEIKYVDQCLVKYRRHSSSVYQPNSIPNVLRLLRHEYYYKKTWLKDALLTHGQDKRLIKELVNERNKAMFLHVVFNTPLLGTLLLHIKKAIKITMRSVGSPNQPAGEMKK